MSFDKFSLTRKVVGASFWRRYQASEIGKNWPIVIGVFVGLMFSIGTIVTYSFGVFAPELVHEFGWSHTQIYIGFMVHNMGIVFGAPFTGYLADRFGARPVILSSILVFAALWASLNFLQPSVWHFYLILASAPIVAGGAMPVAYSRLLVGWFDKQRGLALGLGLAGVGVGAALLPALSQYLIETGGWRTAYLCIGALSASIAFPVAYILLFDPGKEETPIFRFHAWPNGKASGPDNKAFSPARREGIPNLSFQDITQDLKDSRAAYIMLVFFLISGVALTAAIVNLVPVLIDKGVQKSEAALVASALGGAVIVGRVVIGFLLDRFFAAVIIAVVALGPVFAFLILAVSGDLAHAYFASMLMGLTVGAEVDIMAFLVSRYFRSMLFGRIYGVMFSVFVIGGSIGPLAMGAFYDAFGDYRAGLLTMSGLMVCAAVSAILLPPYKFPINHS